MSKKTPLAVTALVFGLSSPLHAEPEPEDLIKYRQSVMKSIGGHMGAAALIMRGKVDYLPQLIDHARALAATTNGIDDIFPEASALGETRAKSEVWENPEEFKKAVEDAQQAADAFLAAVESDNQEDMATRFKALGDTCKGCHDDFREKEE